MYTPVWIHVHMDVHAGEGQRLMLGISVYVEARESTTFFEIDHSLNLKLVSLAGLTG